MKFKSFFALIVAVFSSFPATHAYSQVAQNVEELANTLWADRPAGAFGPELAGTPLRLGMPYEEAHTYVQQRISVAATIRRTSTKLVAGLQPLTLTMLVTQDGGDGFGLVEHPALPGRLVGVTRSTIIDPNVLSTQQVMEALSSVYGRPISPSYDGQRLLIGEDDLLTLDQFSACHRQMGLAGEDIHSESEFAALRETEWVEVYHLSGPLSLVWPADDNLALDWACPTTILVRHENVSKGWRLTISIFDTAWVHDAALRARLQNSDAGASLLNSLTGVAGTEPTTAGTELLKDMLGISAEDVFSADAPSLSDGIAAIEAAAFDRAATILLPLAEAGSAEATGLLAELAYQGHIKRTGPSRDSPLVVARLARFAADAGDVRGIFIKGLTTAVTSEEAGHRARALVETAAEAGHVPAQAFLATAYHQGGWKAYEVLPPYPPHPQSDELALRWAEMAAENGDVDSQFLAGSLRYKGRGVEQDLTVAAAWLEQAVEGGAPQAPRLLKEVRDEIAKIEQSALRAAEAEIRRAELEAAAAERKAEQQANGSGEPTATEMQAAIQTYLGSVNQGMDSTLQTCRGGGFQNDPILAMTCLAMGAASGDMELQTSLTVRISRFEKLGCRESVSQPGYICDYVLGIDGSGLLSAGMLGNIMSGGSATQGRFLRQGNGWLFLPLN